MDPRCPEVAVAGSNSVNGSNRLIAGASLMFTQITPVSGSKAPPLHAALNFGMANRLRFTRQVESSMIKPTRRVTLAGHSVFA